MKLLVVLMSNSATSLVSLLLTVAVSRLGGLEELGEFALGYSLLSVGQIIEREACLNIALSQRGTPGELPRAFTRLLVINIVCSSAILAVGLVLQSSIVSLMAWSSFVFILYDFLRLWLALDDSRRTALFTDVSNLATVGVTLFVVDLWEGPATIVLLVWTIGLSVYCVIVWRASCLIPAGLNKETFDRQSLLFGFQGIVGAGSTHISNVLIGGAGLTHILGSLRGATAFVGPANLVTASIQSTAIDGMRSESSHAITSRRAVFKWFALSFGIGVVLLSMLALLGFLWGETFMGEVWDSSAEIYWWILADAFVVNLVAPVYSAHRADLRARRILTIAILVGVLRIILVPWFAINSGLEGAAKSLLTCSIINAALVWCSYYLYSRNHG